MNNPALELEGYLNVWFKMFAYVLNYSWKRNEVLRLFSVISI